MLAPIDKVIRRLVPGSKERYFSAGKWDDSWSHGYDLNKAREDARYGALTALMLRYEAQGPILDVGCGDGLLEERYRKLSTVPMVAFDYSAVAIEHAQSRQLSNVEFLCADSRSFQADRLFSMVVFNESLYYVDEYLGLMKNLSGSLAQNGTFVVSMHDAPITNRIWRNILHAYTPIQGVELKDEASGQIWRIRVLRP